METEASVTAMAEEMERVRDLPGESDDDDIADRVAYVLGEYGVLEKVFAVTLNNASSNVAAMRMLRPTLNILVLRSL
jgi:hypothetical protein